MQLIYYNATRCMEEWLYIPPIHNYCITYLEVRLASINDRFILDENSAPGSHSIGRWGGEGAHPLHEENSHQNIEGSRSKMDESENSFETYCSLTPLTLSSSEGHIKRHDLLNFILLGHISGSSWCRENLQTVCVCVCIFVLEKINNLTNPIFHIIVEKIIETSPVQLATKASNLII